MTDDLKPATDIDSNAWYQLTEEAVDDYDGDFKSMLQVYTKYNELRVWSLSKESYWQFLPVDDKPGRYAIRCSETTNLKQLSVCYLDEVLAEARRTRACLVDSDDTDAQKWDISLWGTNSTYQLKNVQNGTNYNLDVIPGGAVYMSSNLVGYQSRQRWLMTSVQAVNNEAYSTLASDSPSSTGHTSTTTTASSEADNTSSTGTSSSSSSGSGSDNGGGLSSGAVAGISVGATLAVVALALAAFFFWRRSRRRNQSPSYSAAPDAPDKGNDSPIPVSPAPPHNATTYYGGEKMHTHPSELSHERPPVELSEGGRRYELA